MAVVNPFRGTITVEFGTYINLNCAFGIHAIENGLTFSKIEAVQKRSECYGEYL
jgi:hypothetical protein